MAEDMMFCPYCGSKIKPDGAAVDILEHERVEGVIPSAVGREGQDEGRLFSLVVTTTRVIVAKVTEEDSKRIARSSGSLFMGGAILDPGRHRKTLGAYSIRYLTMDSGKILAESEGNESLKKTDIGAIRISSEEDTEGNKFYLVALETKVGIRKYQIPNDKDSRDLLISSFGPKVHW
jgi:hypothetical protein